MAQSPVRALTVCIATPAFIGPDALWTGNGNLFEDLAGCVIFPLHGHNT